MTRAALILAAIVSIVALCLLPADRAWVADIVGYYEQLPRHLRTPGIADRMRARYYRNYAVLEYIGQNLRPGDVFLLPPLEYVQRRFDPVYWNWAEPKYFYYMLGRWPTATLDSPDAARATCTVVIDGQGRPVFQRIGGPADLARLRAAFQE